MDLNGASPGVVRVLPKLPFSPLTLNGGSRLPRHRASAARSCFDLVDTPEDISPLHSPQAAHTALLNQLVGKAIVEIGTRHGDGMRCFAQVASEAVAIEADPAYCHKLQNISHELLERTGSYFAVRCARYQLGVPDADIYTWWQETPHLSNEEVLDFLAAAHKQGHIRDAAAALVLLEPAWKEDTPSLDQIQRTATNITKVPYDEKKRCHERFAGMPRHTVIDGCPVACCARSRGTFIVARIPLASWAHYRLHGGREPRGTASVALEQQHAITVPHSDFASAPSAFFRRQGSDGRATQKQRVAHVVLANPFQISAVHTASNTRSFNSSGRDGPVSSKTVLRQHLRCLATLPTPWLSLVLVMMPTDPFRALIPGYSDLGSLRQPLRCPLEFVHVSNNSMGSYGMYVHAFMYARGRADLWVFCEVDYVPIRGSYDVALAVLLQQTFLGKPGMLAGVLQGQPVEPRSDKQLHAEGAHVMSTKTLELVLHHVYTKQGWGGDTAEYMVSLVHKSRRPRWVRLESRYDHIQLGWGLLMTEAGVEMREFASAFRTPYWFCRSQTCAIYDWTGPSNGTGRCSGVGDQLVSCYLPMDQALFVPLQMLYHHAVTRCCANEESTCSSARSRCIVKDWREDPDCCPMHAPAAVSGGNGVEAQIARRYNFSSPAVTPELARFPLVLQRPPTAN